MKKPIDIMTSVCAVLMTAGFLWFIMFVITELKKSSKRQEEWYKKTTIRTVYRDTCSIKPLITTP